MTDITQQTIAAIVVNNHKTVPIFEKYQLDFCCKGKRSLADACREKGLDISAIATELQLADSSDLRQMPFNEMNAEQLIGHILTNHHFYVKQAMPRIAGHLEKVAAKHGDNFPWMKEVLQLFTEMQVEMTQHMQKEETILFPLIKKIERSFENKESSESKTVTVNAPISEMEAEHDHAGEIMFRIRALTNNYTAPESACTTFRISLAELKEFEEDLHQHVHLENNILFPMANCFADVPFAAN